MYNAIEIRTKKIVESMEGLLAKALASSGISTFTSMDNDEAIMFKDAMVLMKELDELLVDYAVALDKIDDLSSKLEALSNNQAKQNEYTNAQLDELTRLVIKMSESKESKK